jgi:hypothetical protein
MNTLFLRNVTSLLFFTVHITACGQQTKKAKIPEPGIYSAINTMLLNQYQNEYNYRTGQLELKLKPQITAMPSAFGRLQINENGTYEMLDLKKSGTYKYNEKTKLVEFTGYMAEGMGNYGISRGTCILNISTKTIKDGLHYEMRSKYPQPDAENPNSGFSGILVAALNGKSVDYIDVNTAKTIQTFSYDGNTKSGFYGKSIHSTTAYTYTRDKIEYPEIEIRDNTGVLLKKFAGKSAAGKPWQTSVYQYCSLSPNGKYFLINGQQHKKTNNGFFNTDSYEGYACSVIDAENGNELKHFKGNNVVKWFASWLPNGGILMPGENSEIMITDPSWNTPRMIYAMQIDLANCSLDGEKIIFKKGTQLFTINADGTNEKQFENNVLRMDFGNLNVSDICWSPDSKAVAIVTADRNLSNNFTAFLVSTDGKRATTLRDIKGEQVTLTRPYLSWVSTNRGQATVISQQENTVFGQVDITNNGPMGKVKQNPFFIYKPTKNEQNNSLKSAWEVYTTVMNDDIENFNDPAAALTFIVSLNYMTYHNIQSISTATTQKMYNQFAEHFLQDDTFKKSTDEVKQQLTESVVMDGLQTLEAVKSKDGVKIKEVSMRLMKKYLGTKAPELKITDNGMEF